MKRDSLGFDSNFLTSRDYYEDRKMKSGINLDEDWNWPFVPFPRSIDLPSSRRQVMFGAGDPVASQCKVTLLFSGTTMSVLVG